MAAVACLALGLVTLRPFLEFIIPYTIYSERYSEDAFNTVHPGMPREAVETILGPPLEKKPWKDYQVDGPYTARGSDECWIYSEQGSATSDYYRRWVIFGRGRVLKTVSEFHLD
jgi:hypothetical protein